MRTVSKSKIIDFCARHACGFKSRRSPEYKSSFAYFSNLSEDSLFAYYRSI